MDIDREMLSRRFKEGDMQYVFSEAEKIASFLIAQKYKIYNYDERQDLVQECLERFWKKIKQGKVNPEKNLFAFIWTNSNFRILEILRKENNRKRIARFIEYDEIESGVDHIDFGSHMGDRYMSVVVKELSTVG